jgi:hypothetical protein
LGKAEDKRAAIIAQQAERQQAQQAEQGTPAAWPKRRTNWAATAAFRPVRGRPPTGGARK